MKKMKRLFAVLLAMAMVMGLSMTAFAVDETPTAGVKAESTTIIDYPQAGDTVNVKIGGLTGNPTVTLYQIASANYSNTSGSKGFINYTWTTKEIDFKKSTSDQITEIANSLVANSNATVIAGGSIGNDGVYTATVNAGVYIAVITGASDGTVYNPVLLTATYARTNEGNTALEGGALQIDAADAHYLNGLTAVVKKSEPIIDKEITGGTQADKNENNEDIDTVSVGDTVKYTISPTMPSYPKEAVNKALAISDRPSTGLDFQFETLSMTLNPDKRTVDKRDETNGDGEVVSSTFSYQGKIIAYAKPAEGGFNMTFVYDNLIYGDQGAVYTPVITYDAIVTDDAVVGSTGNDNTATLYYTNQPNTSSSYDPSNGDLPTGDDIETKNDKEIVYTYQLAFHKVGNANDKDKAGLAGAQFGIYSDEACENLIDIVTTNDDGYAVSSKVEAGEYFIKEIKAPAGYTLNTNVYKAVANWMSATTTTSETITKREYTAKKSEAVSDVQVGWLDSNNVFYNMSTIDTEGLFEAYLKSETTTAKDTTLTETNPGAGTVTSITFEDKPVNSIENTTLTALPSTGGMGTMIFTVAGCLIMIVAAGFYFSGRKKSAAK